MQLTFSMPVMAADPGRRTVTGQIVPFGKPGNTNQGPVVFEPHAFGTIDASAVKLLLEHDHRRPIGRMLDYSVNPGGITATFRVAQTQAGTDALIEASDGLRDGFSVGASVQDYEVRDGVMHVTAATLHETSLVTDPAFGSEAKVEKVAASNPEQSETETPEETLVSEMPIEAPAEAPEPVEASAPVVVAQAAPIFTQPRISGLSSADYFAHAIKAATGDRDSQLIVRAADDSTATNTGLTLPYHKQQFVSTSFTGRPAIDAIGVGALAETGMSYTVPKLTTAPTVATVAEGGAPSETGMVSGYSTCTIVKKSGINRVSFELLERSGPSFQALLLEELRRAYAKNTDEYVIAQLTAGGTAATATAATYAGMVSFIATEGPAAYSATGGMYASELIGSTAWWTTLLAATDGSNRPMFPDLGPMNAPGRVGSQSSLGVVNGTNFSVDHNIATVGIVDESAFLVAPGAVLIEESPTTELRVNVLTSGEVEIGIHGYIAATVLVAGGVRRWNTV